MSALRMAVAATVTLLLSSSVLVAQSQTIPLWPNGAPGSEGKTAAEAVRLTEQGEHIVSSVHRPSLTPYLPGAALTTGAAVIVIPGGGHRELWMDHEGYRVGQWLSDHGIAAFVLKYRLAREPGSSYTVEGNSLADVQRAIRVVRSRASEWHIAADRIGVMGFSAGGELAALAGTRYDAGTPGAADLVDRESSKPAFMGLIYPSIPRDMSLSKETPPAFLLCGANDSPAIAEGVPALFLSMKRAGVPAEMHILTGVGHGFGVRANNPRAVANWTSLLYDWLEARGLVASRTGDAQLSPQMRAGIARAKPVPVYSVSHRANAVQIVLKQATPPVLGATVSLTPNMPSAPNGAHLSFWKPSFVLGTPSGGEAGFNFWGVHNDGHVNVGFTSASATSHVLDCRILSAGAITYKVYAGGSSPRDAGVTPLNDGHFLLIVPAASPGAAISVELWPTPAAETLGFLGCELSTIE